jgi:hypothetical protein
MRGVEMESPNTRKSDMRKLPWHSIKAGVHHVCTNCHAGKNIEKENVRAGIGGRPLCRECRKWIDRKRC